MMHHDRGLHRGAGQGAGRQSVAVEERQHGEQGVLGGAASRPVVQLPGVGDQVAVGQHYRSGHPRRSTCWQDHCRTTRFETVAGGEPAVEANGSPDRGTRHVISDGSPRERVIPVQPPRRSRRTPQAEFQ